MEGCIKRIAELALVVLLVVISCLAMMDDHSYWQQSASWRAQAQAQDIIDLFIVAPAFIIVLLFSPKSRVMRVIRAGILLYLAYTFTLYCFTIYFSGFFIPYCLIWGTSVYLFVAELYQEITAPALKTVHDGPYRITAVYFIALSAMFSMLWIKDIITALQNNTVPDVLREAGLVANPVYILDLGLVLPAFFITGMLIFRRHYLAWILIPVLLTFSILMSITIAGLALFMQQKGVEADTRVALVMFSLAAIGLVLLTGYFKTFKKMVRYNDRLCPEKI